MNPKNTVSTSGSLLAAHLSAEGFESIEDFIARKNPTGQTESLDVPGMPSIKIIQDGTPARHLADSQGAFVISYATVGDAKYSVLQVS